MALDPNLLSSAIILVPPPFISEDFKENNGTVLLEDFFQDDDGTNLTAHTMNTGSGWTLGTISSQGTARCVISANQADFTTSDGAAWAWAETNNSDVTIIGDFLTTDNFPAGSNGLVGRVTDANNLWIAELVTPETNLLRITEVNGGTATVRATTAFTSVTNTFYRMVFAMSGTTLTAYVNGTTVTYTSSLFQTNTKHGIAGVKKNSSVGTRHRHFLVTTP